MANKKVVFDIEANDMTGDGIDQVEEKLGGAGDAAEGSGLKFTELSSAMNIVSQVANYAQQAYSALIQPTIDLGLATYRLSGSMGVTTEEASTMIQMLEDYGLTTEETTAAMEMAVRKGYAPTIDGLAQIADELKNEQDPLKQGTMLFDLFGKKGQEVGLLLRQGGDAVRASADDIKSMGLAMSQVQVDDILAYRESLNDLGDSWAAVGMQVTKGFIPPITEALVALGDLLTMNQRVAQAVRETGERVAAEGKTYDYYQESILDIARANGSLTVAQRAMIEEFDRSGPSWRVTENDYKIITERLGLMTREEFNNVVATNAMEEATLAQAQADRELAAAAAQAAAELTASYSTILELSKQLQAETNNYSQKQADLTAKIADTNAKLAEAVTLYGADSEQARGYQSSLADLNGQVTKLETDHSNATATIVYNNLLQKLSVDGLTDAEFAMAQQMGVSLGIFEQATADEATALNGLTTAVINGKISQEQFTSAVYGGRDSITALWNSINALPKNTDIAVNTHRNETYTYTEYRNIYQNNMSTGVWRQAAGGEGVVPPGYTHDNFLVGLSSGEKFRTTPSSRVGASESGGSRGGGGNTYNFNAYGIQNPSAFMEWVNKKVEQQDGAI